MFQMRKDLWCGVAVIESNAFGDNQCLFSIGKLLYEIPSVTLSAFGGYLV